MIAKTWAATALALFSGLTAATEIPDEFRGTWKPSTAKCRGKAALTVESDALVLSTAKGRTQRWGDVSVCSKCEGGNPQYSGIVVWVSPRVEKPGEQPFFVFFNAKEKRGVTAITARDKKLARQFPVMAKKLAKCA